MRLVLCSTIQNINRDLKTVFSTYEKIQAQKELVPYPYHTIILITELGQNASFLAPSPMLFLSHVIPLARELFESTKEQQIQYH